MSGWKLTDISCSDGTSTSPSVWDLANKTATFNVENGETVTCTFTNTKYGSISGHKYEDSDGKVSTTSDRSLLSGWVMNLWQWVTDKFVDTGKTAIRIKGIIFSVIYYLVFSSPRNFKCWANLLSQMYNLMGESNQNNNFVNYESVLFHCKR